MGTWVGAKEGLAVGTWVGAKEGFFVVGASLGTKEGLVAGTVHVLTAQKGPPVEMGVACKVHPEFRNMLVFVMLGILSFHAHMFWLNADASANMMVMSITEPTSQLEMSWLNAVAL